MSHLHLTPETCEAAAQTIAPIVSAMAFGADTAAMAFTPAQAAEAITSVLLEAGSQSVNETGMDVRRIAIVGQRIGAILAARYGEATHDVKSARMWSTPATRAETVHKAKVRLADRWGGVATGILSTLMA